MKKLNELTKEECQVFINKMVNGAEFINLILDKQNDYDYCGIEYKIDDKQRVLSFSDPELISILYENDIDLTMPLKQLTVDYLDLDETNSVLFEYAMGVSRIINNYNYYNVIERIDEISGDRINSKNLEDSINSAGLIELKKLHRELVNKI